MVMSRLVGSSSRVLFNDRRLRVAASYRRRTYDDRVVRVNLAGARRLGHG
jgi:hypothetical protein